MVLSSAAGADVDDLVVAMIRPRDAPHEAVNAVALELMDVLSSEQGLAEAIDALLSAIGQRLDWDVADLWVIDDERGVTRVLGQWTADPVGLADFQEASRGVSLRPGEGLPGRVWATGVPVTIERIGDDPVLRRQEQAQAAGLHTAGRVPGRARRRRGRRHRAVPAAPPAGRGRAGGGPGRHRGAPGRHLHRVQAAERQHRADQRQRLITAGVERLVAWLDYPAPLNELCDLLVPDIADACVVDLVADTGLDRVGEAYISADYSEAVAQLSELVPIETVEAGPMAVLRNGETVVYDDIGAETLAAGLPAEVPAELIERLSPTSTLIVPLIGRGRVVGTMTLTRQGGRYDDEDRRFAEELGRHVGLAVANAHLYERERSVAIALQLSLLPPSLPEIDGLEVAARYEPGSTHLVVGGDFYDLFAVEPGTWYAVVGDVCGTGAEAAAITSQVRYTARAWRRGSTGRPRSSARSTPRSWNGATPASAPRRSSACDRGPTAWP